MPFLCELCFTKQSEPKGNKTVLALKESYLLKKAEVWPLCIVTLGTERCALVISVRFLELEIENMQTLVNLNFISSVF